MPSLHTSLLAQYSKVNSIFLFAKNKSYSKNYLAEDRMSMWKTILGNTVIFINKEIFTTSMIHHTKYRQTLKTVNTWKISGILIVYWRITIKFRTRKQTAKPQTNYCYCLRFSFLAPHKYFWCSSFVSFTVSKRVFLYTHIYIQGPT